MQDRTEYRKQYRLKNRKKLNAYNRAWHRKNKDARRRYHEKYRIENLETYRKRDREKTKEFRLEALSRYGGGIPKCVCCGEGQIQFLAFDHINGRKGIKYKHRGKSWYRQLARNEIDPNIQILCHNCNLAKGFYGKCPHKVCG